MKILFLAVHLKSGGAERTISYLSNYFVSKEHKVVVLSIENEVFYDFDKRVKILTLGIPSKSESVVGRFTNMVKRAVLVNRAIRKETPDVVFCMLPEVARYLPLRYKTYSLISSERINPEAVDKKRIRFKEKVFLNSDGVIFQTKRAMNFYSKNIREKATVIHNAVGNSLVYDLEKPIVREDKISAIGRLTKQKNYPLLLRAFADFSRVYPNYRLEIFGDGKDREVLEKLAVTLNVDKNVSFMGNCKDAIVRAADSKMYVLSSDYEGMPNALMEAMAVGLPCISTDCPNGPAELIEHRKNGILVPVNSQNELRDAMIEFASNEGFANQCGENANKILLTHSIDSISEQYLSYIEKVHNQKK